MPGFGKNGLNYGTAICRTLSQIFNTALKQYTNKKMWNEYFVVLGLLSLVQCCNKLSRHTNLISQNRFHYFWFWTVDMRFSFSEICHLKFSQNLKYSWKFSWSHNAKFGLVCQKWSFTGSTYLHNTLPLAVNYLLLTLLQSIDFCHLESWSWFHLLREVRYPTIYTVSQKNIPDIFDCNFKKSFQILIIFVVNIADTTCHQMTFQLFTSLNVCLCTTKGMQTKWNMRWNI